MFNALKTYMNYWATRGIFGVLMLGLLPVAAIILFVAIFATILLTVPWLLIVIAAFYIVFVFGNLVKILMR